MNALQTYDAGVSHQIGRYSDAIRVPAGYDQIVVSGTPGLDENGNIPDDFADEARQAWRNVAAILEKAGASISDIVSIRQYLTRAEDIKTYVAVQPETRGSAAAWQWTSFVEFDRAQPGEITRGLRPDDCGRTSATS